MIGSLISGIGSTVGGIAQAAGRGVGTVVNAGGQVLATTAQGAGGVLQTVAKQAPTILNAAGELYGTYAGYQATKANQDLQRRILASNVGYPGGQSVVVPAAGAPAVVQPTATQTDTGGQSNLLLYGMIGLGIVLWARQ